MGESRIAVLVVGTVGNAPTDCIIELVQINACVVATGAEPPEGYVLLSISMPSAEAVAFARKLDGARPITGREGF